MIRLWTMRLRRGSAWCMLRVRASSEREAISKIPSSYDDWAVMEIG